MNNITQEQALLLADVYADQNYIKTFNYLKEQLIGIGFLLSEEDNQYNASVFSAMVEGIRIWMQPEHDTSKGELEECAYDILKEHYPNLDFMIKASDSSPLYVEIKLKNDTPTLV